MYFPGNFIQNPYFENSMDPISFSVISRFTCLHYFTLVYFVFIVNSIKFHPNEPIVCTGKSLFSVKGFLLKAG